MKTDWLRRLKSQNEFYEVFKATQQWRTWTKTEQFCLIFLIYSVSREKEVSLWLIGSGFCSMCSVMMLRNRMKFLLMTDKPDHGSFFSSSCYISCRFEKLVVFMKVSFIFCLQLVLSAGSRYWSKPAQVRGFTSSSLCLHLSTFSLPCFDWSL